MRKRWISLGALLAYSVILIQVVVFKEIPIFRIGNTIFRFNVQNTGPPNFMLFRTIGYFLYGTSDHLFAIVNLVGNIAPFVPVGLLATSVFRLMSWQKALLLAVAVGLAMECMEAIFRVGIFDVDDIMLNALGVMLGHGIIAATKGPMRFYSKSN